MKVENKSIAMMIALLGAIFLTVAALTLASAPPAEAANGSNTVTRVFVDGEKKRTIVGNGTAQFRVSAGCHTIKAVKTRQGQNARSVSSSRLCSSSPETITVRVRNGNVTVISSNGSSTGNSSSVSSSNNSSSS